MILSLTPNTALDLTTFISELTPDRTIRATQTYHSMGGKPTDVSWILGRMGVPNLALGFKAGAIGEKVIGMLQDFDVATDFVEADGETRINTVIIDENSGTQTTITTASMSVTVEHIDDLMMKCMQALNSAKVLVTGGSLPQGVRTDFYKAVIRQAHLHRVPVILDASEPNLSIGLEVKPTFIKPNQDELGALVGHDITSIDSAYQAGCAILEQYDTQSIISRGKDDSIAVLQDRAYRIPSIPIDVKSAAGAGDGIVAGVAHAIHQGDSIEDGLRLGFALATAVCLQPGTAVYHVADMEALLPQIELILYP